MKKSIIIILVAILAIPLVSLRAETTKPAQEIPTRQNILKERLERQRQNYLQNLSEAREIAKEYRSSTNPEERRELRQKARQGFMVRLTNAAQKLSEMQDRVEARIAFAEEKGFNVEKAKAYLETSRQELELVINEQEKLKEVLGNDDETDDITKEEAREIFTTIKEHFNLSRKALVDAIQSLQQIVTSQDSDNDEGTNTEVENETNDETE